MTTFDRKPDAPEFLFGGGATGALMRRMNWQDTPFGKPDSWPQSLRSAVSICLGTNFPIAIYWGPDLALLYNDAWSDIPGEKHPWAMGRPGRDVWPEIWDAIGPLFDRVQATGEGVWQEDQLLPMHRHGYTEECYFNFTFSPIRGENGAVEGIFNAVVETTFRVIEERRERTLRGLAEQLAAARSESDVITAAFASLQSKPEDLPFCLLYGLDDDSRAVLEGRSGLADPAVFAPSDFDASAGTHSGWPLITANSQNSLVVDLLEQFHQGAQGAVWPEQVTQALIARIDSASGGESRRSRRWDQPASRA